jgi:hypothetical protein
VAFWQFTGSSAEYFPSLRFTAKPGLVYDLGGASPPAEPYVLLNGSLVAPTPASKWTSVAGPATDTLPDLLQSSDAGTGVAAGTVLKDVSYVADPGTPRLITRITATVTSAFANLAEVYVNSSLSTWLNEWGAMRGQPHSNSKFDALVRAFRRTDLSTSTHQGSGYAAFEIINGPTTRDRQWWGRDYASGALFREAVKHMDVLLWHTGDPDPTTDTTGVYGYGSASTGYTQSISPTTLVILIQNASAEATPSWAPAGRTIRFNLA